MSAPTVVVVVPTRDRPESLAACLDALAEQDGAPDEVVVVDDGSVQADRVARVAARRGARLVVGEGRGPAAARNLGAAAARADVVCFTDDDCRPRPRWTAALAGAVEAGAPAAAGPTVVGDARRRMDAAAQVVTNHLVTASYDSATSTVGFAPTCNLAVRSEVLAEVPFDEHFPLAAGEDREWCDRLAEAGHVLRWVPDAEVRHHPGLDLRRFWRQQVRYGRGGQRLRQVRPAAGRVQGPRFYLDLLGAGLRRGPTVAGLVGLAQAATTVGVLQEVVVERRARGVR